MKKKVFIIIILTALAIGGFYSEDLRELDMWLVLLVICWFILYKLTNYLDGQRTNTQEDLDEKFSEFHYGTFNPADFNTKR